MNDDQNVQEGAQHAPRPRQTVFGRRRGRPLRVRKAALVETHLPRLRIPEGEETLDLPALYGQVYTDYVLEIGFGGGEHLAEQAARNPTMGFIGCEPFENGVASALDHIDRRGLTNIRIWPNDARVILNRLPPAVLGRCYVLFADPWPKARHAERRFIGTETIPMLARVLRAGGELRLATDDAQLAEWMTEHMRASPLFEEAFHGPDRPTDWVPTRYEEKGIRAGRLPTYMGYRRR